MVLCHKSKTFGLALFCWKQGCLIENGDSLKASRRHLNFFSFILQFWNRRCLSYATIKSLKGISQKVFFFVRRNFQSTGHSSTEFEGEFQGRSFEASGIKLLFLAAFEIFTLILPVWDSEIQNWWIVTCKFARLSGGKFSDSWLRVYVVLGVFFSFYWQWVLRTNGD